LVWVEPFTFQPLEFIQAMETLTVDPVLLQTVKPAEAVGTQKQSNKPAKTK
jgi:hypothetical protein